MGWNTVAAPTQAMNFIGANYNITWKYPFDAASPAGTYEISNAIMDRSHRVGAWSLPTTLALNSGWFLRGATWNQPITADETGVVWKVKKIAGANVGSFTNGSEHLFMTGETSTVRPYSASLPYLSPLTNRWEGYGTIAGLTTGGRHTTPAVAPPVYASQIPNVEMDIAYARMTETGETALSPLYHYTPTLASLISGTVAMQFTITEPHPQGTIGYCVYIRLTSEGIWRRVPPPECVGTPVTADDWLWQWWDKQPLLIRMAGSVTFTAAGTAESRLNDLQEAIKNGAANFVAPAGTNYDCYCPVIDEYRTGPPATFFRNYTSADGGYWTLTRKASQLGHTYFPVLAIYNQYSTWNNLRLIGDGASAAVAFADYSGGQGFGVKFNNCLMSTGLIAGGTRPDEKITAAAMVNTKCTGAIGGHTASELSFTDCTLSGDVAIWMAGQQTANVRFHHTHAYAGAGRKACGVYFECPNQIRFTNGLYIEGSQAGAIFRTSEWAGGYIFVNDIWNDQGFRCLLECNICTTTLVINGGKINPYVLSPGTGERVTMARFVNPPFGASKIKIIDMLVQFNQTPAIDIINPDFNTVSLEFQDTAIADWLVLREPTRAQANAAAYTFFLGHFGQEKWAARELPGIKIPLDAFTLTIPAFTLTIPSTAVTRRVANSVKKVQTTVPQIDIAIGAQTVTIDAGQATTVNSLTNRALVQRADWTS